MTASDNPAEPKARKANGYPRYPVLPIAAGRIIPFLFLKIKYAIIP